MIRLSNQLIKGKLEKNRELEQLIWPWEIDTFKPVSYCLRANIQAASQLCLTETGLLQ